MSTLKRIKVFSIEEVEKLIKKYNKEWDGITHAPKTNKYNIKVNGYDVYACSLRYKTFMEKGYTCECCGRKGSYYALEIFTGQKMNQNRAHFNLYSEDDVLMTKDHIFPKSKGGKDKIDNMQTMCQICNVKKGNILPSKFNKTKKEN